MVPNRIPLLLAPILVCGTTSPAAALNMPSYDLASLFHLAEIVVEVEAPPLIEGRRPHGTVLGVLKGNVRKGDVLTFGTYPYRPVKGVERWRRGRETLVLFLNWNPGFGCFMPVAAGVKVLRGDDVFGFVQRQNPGPYELTPQGAEFIEVAHKSKYDREAFFRDLDAAAERADTFAKAVEAADAGAVAEFVHRLHFRWNRPVHFVRDDPLHAAAVQWLATRAEPEFLLAFLEDEDTSLDESALETLQHGFSARPRLEYVWSVAEGTGETEERRRALALVADNREGDYVETELRGEARKEAVEEFQWSNTRRAMAILANDPDPGIRRAAGEAMAAWHPMKRQAYSVHRGYDPVVHVVTPPPPNDDPALQALRLAIEKEPNASTRESLTDAYRALAQLSAPEE